MFSFPLIYIFFCSFSEGQIEDFVKKSKLLFSRHFVELRNREEVSAIASVKKLSDKRKGLNEVRALIRPDLEDIESGGPTFDAEIQAKEFVEKEFELMKKLCEVLFDQKRYPELQRITFSALGSPIFNKHTEIIKVHNKQLLALWPRIRGVTSLKRPIQKGYIK